MVVMILPLPAHERLTRAVARQRVGAPPQPAVSRLTGRAYSAFGESALRAQESIAGVGIAAREGF